MDEVAITTKFGRAEVKVHRLTSGWRAMLVGRHHVPTPPVLRGPVAQTADEAVAQLVRAIHRMELLS